MTDAQAIQELTPQNIEPPVKSPESEPRQYFHVRHEDGTPLFWYGNPNSEERNFELTGRVNAGEILSLKWEGIEGGYARFKVVSPKEAEKPENQKTVFVHRMLPDEWESLLAEYRNRKEYPKIYQFDYVNKTEKPPAPRAA